MHHSLASLFRIAALLLLATQASQSLHADEFDELMIDDEELGLFEDEAVSATTSGSQFAAEGKLATRRTRSGRVRYVLLDEFDDPIALISPSSGFNLRPYLGRTVGVSPKAFTYREGKLPNIVAHRLTVLQAGQRASGINLNPVRQAAHAEGIRPHRLGGSICQ